MKEQYSERELHQVLSVLSAALQKNMGAASWQKHKPVIVFDGLGECDPDWLASREGQLCLNTLLQWCCDVTKERGLAHIIFTGNERVVFELLEQSRTARGHLEFIGLAALEKDAAVDFISSQLPDATREDHETIYSFFGGWIHGESHSLWDYLLKC